VRSEGGLVERLRSHYERLKPERIGVAVSGGSDSLALLHAAVAWGVGVEAVTVDHGLRPEAAAEAAQVALICARLGVPHTILRWEGWDGRGNLQDQARQNRYALIGAWARGRGLPSVALGHTMDDQAETLLMRLGREAGVEGLASMRLVFEREGDAVRPALPVRPAGRPARLSRGAGCGLGRRSVERGRGLRPGPGAAGAVGSGAARDRRGEPVPGGAEPARRERRLGQAADLRAREGADGGGDLIFDRTALRRQPAEIVRRLLGHGAHVRGSGRVSAPARAAGAAFAQVTAGGNTTLHGCLVMVSDMTVRIAREHAAVARLSGPTDALWDGRWRLTGPHAPGLEVRALGEAVRECPEWRAAGLPRATLLASPAVWEGARLVAAPVAGMGAGWVAEVGGAADFAAFLIAH
jgi:tRNA(Ile)-lysidine synthase